MSMMYLNILSFSDMQLKTGGTQFDYPGSDIRRQAISSNTEIGDNAMDVFGRETSTLRQNVICMNEAGRPYICSDRQRERPSILQKRFLCNRNSGCGKRAAVRRSFGNMLKKRFMCNRKGCGSKIRRRNELNNIGHVSETGLEERNEHTLMKVLMALRTIADTGSNDRDMLKSIGEKGQSDFKDEVMRLSTFKTCGSTEDGCFIRKIQE
mgnify:FL=1